MKIFLRYKLNLQLFASDGEGAADSQTGVITADAEQEGSENSSDEFSRLINGKFKNEFAKKTQAIIDKRFKTTKELEEYKAKISPLVDRLMEKYALSPGEEASLEAILFENDGKMNENNDEFDEEYEKKELFTHQDVIKNKIGGWLKESEELKAEFPDFDLRGELRENKLFSQLLLGGVPLKIAYETVHKDEILSSAVNYTADTVRRQVVQNIEAKGRRPVENGVSSEAAVVTSVDVNSLTSQDILKILKQVENGANIKF